MYGFIYNLPDGSIELHVLNCPYHIFMGYTLEQAKKLYRKMYNLKYKRITWL